MTFREEFPDYPAGEMPAAPEGFDDTSWHNDACPSFTSDALGLTIFVDYPTPEDREFPDTRRFSVSSQDHGVETSGPCFDTDDWQEVLDFIAAHRKTVQA